jgi:hypothetical protein
MVRLKESKPIFKNGSLIGLIRKDRVYISHRNKNHWFRKYNGFGISASVLEELRKYEVQLIKIVYTKTDKTQEVYITQLTNFYEKGIIYKDGFNDYQRILNIKEFKKV